MRKDVKVELTRGSRDGDDVVGFTVSHEGTDPQKVALVANRLAADYIAENLKMRENQARGTADFLRNQLQELSRKLADQEKVMALATLKRHTGGPPEGIELELKRLSREYEDTLETYKSIAVRQRESALAESMEMRQKGEQFRVIDPALPSEDPIAPRRLRLYAWALAIALAVAAVVNLLIGRRLDSQAT
jgi:uncharacterized protein involved in exopolysaccharide biosynthesis